MEYAFTVSTRHVEGVPQVIISGDNKEIILYAYQKINITKLVAKLNYRFSSSFRDAKGRMKELTEYIGCTPSKFCKLLNAVQYKVFIAELDDDPAMKDFRMKFGFRLGGCISPDRINKIHKAKELLKQTHKDGIVNISPFVFKYNKTPQELKQMYGKGLWKVLCRNTFSRNKLLAAAEGCLDKQVGIPSTLLSVANHSSMCYPDTVMYYANNFKGKYKDHKLIRKVLQITQDTERMADRLGEKFSMNWTPEVMQQKHYLFTKMITEQKYSKAPFAIVKNLRNIYRDKFSSFEGNYVAEVINSAYDLAEEGREMHHCVAGYAGEVSNRRYVVFSIKDKEGNRYSTLGITIDTAGNYRFQQHYKKYNAYVEDPEVKQLAEAIVFELNKETK